MWKIIELNPMYEISDIGEVRNRATQKLLKPATDKNGYKKVWLSFGKRNTAKPFFVHRLVGFAFIENVYDYPEINHINHVRDDNSANNLEWCTTKYNVQDAKGHKIIASKDGDIIGVFNSIKDAAKHLNMSDTMIGYCLNGRYEKAKGFSFEYAK